MPTEMPRILSPNLGCPLILSLQELRSQGFDLVIAAGAELPPGNLSVAAFPSYGGQGREFILDLENPRELTAGTLPSQFHRVEETRFLMSTILQRFILAGQARFFRFRAMPKSSPGQEVFRRAGGEPRGTLYDLRFIEGEKAGGAVFHALSLRPEIEGLSFIHLTDLHVALRNDLYADNLKQNVTLQDPADVHFNNFNENLRRFISYANSLADRGKLDLVLLTGDLIDFLRHGFQEEDYYSCGNFSVFRELILGTGKEKDRQGPNAGLKVPMFTGTGNHDWRLFPYNPEVSHKVFRINREAAGQLDLFWADEQEAISRKCDSFYGRLLREGAPISNKTGWGKMINWGLRYLEKWQVKLLTPVSASALAGWGDEFPLVGDLIRKVVGQYDNFFWGALALVGVPLVMESVTGYMKRFTRKRIFDLMAIEAGWPALKEYFLTVNPFFNYAFRVGGNYFLMLDTGHDCVRAQMFWDDGEKKLGPVSIHDNTIGQSPDSMAFYDINEYYPYSQIGWIERLMELIQAETKGKNRAPRVFVGLHAPPANLSKKEARRAHEEAGESGVEGIRLPEGEFNIRYGTINHYLSHFYHLCLGRTEHRPEEKTHPPVDMVLAGHAHWKLEFRLAWEEEEKQEKKKIAVYFGDFSAQADSFQRDFDRNRPFLLQTPGCGPREDFSPDPPYFRFVEIDGQGKILSAQVLCLDLDGKAGAARLPLP